MGVPGGGQCWCGVFAAPHLLVLAGRVPLGAGDEPLELVEAALHVLQAEARLVLLAPDALQQPLAVLLRHARALLPLLDPLRQDLVDPAGGGAGGKGLMGGERRNGGGLYWVGYGVIVGLGGS